MDFADLPRPVGYVLGGGGSLGAVQVGMLQALGERDIAPDIVAGSSVGSLNGAVVAQDPKGAANRLSHFWARLTRGDVFPGGLLAQATRSFLEDLDVTGPGLYGSPSRIGG